LGGAGRFFTPGGVSGYEGRGAHFLPFTADYTKGERDGAIVTRGPLAAALALVAFAGLGAFGLREHHYVQTVWLLLFTWAAYVVLVWKPKSVKAFFGYAFGEAVGTVILRMLLGFFASLAP
jgi:hypothetical protein